MENLFEQIMKENISNLEKELDMQVQDSQSDKEIESKKNHTKTHYN